VDVPALLYNPGIQTESVNQGITMDETISENTTDDEERHFLSMRALIICLLIMSGFNLITDYLAILYLVPANGLEGVKKYDWVTIKVLLGFALFTILSTTLVLFREQSFQHLRRDMRFASTINFLLYLITLATAGHELPEILNGFFCFGYFLIWVFFLVGISEHRPNSVFRDSGDSVMQGIEFISGKFNHPIKYLDQVQKVGKVNLPEIYLICCFTLVYSFALAVFVSDIDYLESIWSNTSNIFIYVELGMSILFLLGIIDLANHWEAVENGKLVLRVLSILQLVWMGMVSMIIKDFTPLCLLPVIVPFALMMDFFQRMKDSSGNQESVDQGSVVSNR
jgi:hypothetical protein